LGGPIGCRDEKYRKIKNAVIHAGGGQSRIYVKFLNEFFSTFPSVYIDQQYDEKCLVFDKPFDFFQNYS
jgi:hypothetical protein